MEKIKIHPLTLIALGISSILMALYAEQNFKDGQTVSGMVFSLICVIFLAMVINGFIRSKNGSRE